MNDKQVQDLINGMFMNEMTFRTIDEAKAARASGKQVKLPLFYDIIGWGFVLFWTVVIGGAFVLSILGFILDDKPKQKTIQESQGNVTVPINTDSQPSHTTQLDNSTQIGRYMGMVQSSIKRNWNLPQDAMKQNGFDNVKVVVGFTLSKSGNLIGQPRIIQSSGLDIADQRCLQAVQLSAPFKPFPEEITKDYLDMQFTFEASRNQ